MLGGGWTEPLARGVDLGSTEAAEIQRRIVTTKPSLRRVYERVYAKMLAATDRYVPGAKVRIELGSGGGFLPEVDPSIVASDIRPIPGLDLVFDAQHAPFRDAGVDAILAMHVIHHIPRIRLFFAELERVLRPGGALIAVEPYWSPMAKVMYKHMHPEPFDERADRWEFESSGPMMSNQAMSSCSSSATARCSSASSRSSRSSSSAHSADRATCSRAASGSRSCYPTARSRACGTSRTPTPRGSDSSHSTTSSSSAGVDVSVPAVLRALRTNGPIGPWLAKTPCG
jgi:hypothetical protein